MMNKALTDYQDVRTVTIRTITSIHIGNGEIVRAKEYVYIPTAHTVYFLNTAKWQNFIAQHNLFSSYEHFMDSNSKCCISSLYEWLEKTSRIANVEETIEDLSNSKAVVPGEMLRNKKKNTLNDIVRQAKDIYGQPVIPGSSIKGLIRTAVLYHLLQLPENQHYREKAWQQTLQMIARRDSKKLDMISNTLETELLHILSIGNEEGKTLNNAVKSVMKGILCSDAMPRGRTSLGILQKIDGTRKGRDHKERPIPLYRECILPNQTFTCTIKIEKEITKLIGITSVDDMIRMVEDFYQEVGHVLRKEMDDIYHCELSDLTKGNAFLGGGVGYLSKTLLLFLATDKKGHVDTDQSSQAIKQFLAMRFQHGGHRHSQSKLQPHTIKLTRSKEKQMLMGIIKVDIHE